MFLDFWFGQNALLPIKILVLEKQIQRNPHVHIDGMLVLKYIIMIENMWKKRMDPQQHLT